MECIICKEEGNKECIFRLENCACSSYYCKECLSLWFKNNKKVKNDFNCLYCMKPLSIKDLKKLDIKTSVIFDNCIKEGNIEVIKSMIAEGYVVEWNIMKRACQYGHLKVVKYLHEVVSAICTDWVMFIASSNGHLEVVKYLHEVVGIECTEWAMYLASSNGYLEVVKYLHEVGGVECTENTMNWASAEGHLEMVKYLHEVVGIECTEYAMDYASKNGRLEIVKYLREAIGV